MNGARGRRTLATHVSKLVNASTNMRMLPSLMCALLCVYVVSLQCPVSTWTGVFIVATETPNSEYKCVPDTKWLCYGEEGGRGWTNTQDAGVAATNCCWLKAKYIHVCMCVSVCL